jgi:hypothetical protein
VKLEDSILEVVLRGLRFIRLPHKRLETIQFSRYVDFSQRGPAQRPVGFGRGNVD